MRCGHPLALCALVALSLFNGIAFSRGVVLPRQDEISATTSGSINSPSTTSAPQRSAGASITGDIQSTTDVEPISTSAVVGKEASGTRTTENDTRATSTDGPLPTASSDLDNTSSGVHEVNPEDQVYQGGLPIKPKVNPGIAVAGVILMLAGVPYCLIGIKLKFLHIFLSTFFLSGLGVTVLIIYVMNPPVQDAIQGAYVTAIVITGVLTGALAIVFPEVTEALGCLLGGFCVSMWFLVLKPGGLVTSIYGKLVLIAAFCFVAFSLAFHRITRPYSLIFSLAFSGATAIVLGIDCFSRAGLKEFWVYIWALNDNVFPLGTNNYPHTRGIRVEIAVIVLITAFGIMSQVKLWKILKERRDAKDTEKRRQVADLEALDEDVGRRVEESHKVERAQWEMAYGGKSMAEGTEEERPNTGKMSRADSGIGDEDLRKRSGEAEEFVETEEMKRGRKEHIQMMESRKQSLEVPSQQRNVQDDQTKGIDIPVDVDEIQEIDFMMAGKEGESLNLGSDLRHQSTQSNRRQSSQSQRLSSQAIAEKPNVPPTPEVIPLPVPIPIEEEDDEDDISSLATWAGESARSIMQEDQELAELVITPTLMKSEDDDGASSVAATLDEDYDALDIRNLPAINEASERSTSPLSADNDITPVGMSFRISTNPATQESTPEKKSAYYLPVLELQPSESGKDSTMSSFDKGMFTGNHSKTNTTHQTTPAATSPPSVDEPSPKTTKFPGNVPASFPGQNTTAPSSVSANFNPQLQAKCSRVVKNYRTNEWAKHLADAEIPELGKLEEPQVVVDIPTEVSAPVHIKELQETSEVSFQPPRSASKMSMHEPVNPTLVSTNSFPITGQTIRPMLRTSSIPIIPQEERPSSVSPVERCVSPTSGHGRLTPSPLPHNTLLGKRESMVRSRQTFNTLPEYGPPSPTGSPDPTRSQSPNIGLINHPIMSQSRSPTPGMQLPTNDNPSSYQHRVLDDDMPLADRRNELLHHSGSQNTLNQGRRSFTPVQQPADRREARLKSWRESIKTELQNSGHTVHAIQERRGDTLTERQQLALAEKQKSMKDNYRDEMVDERMRQKDMIELHKEALRKMQAGANKHI